MIWLFAGAMALTFAMHILALFSAGESKKPEPDYTTGNFLIGELERLDRALHGTSDNTSV